MNNCYGKNNDMQQRIVNVFPSIGESFEIKICVPDTDDTERIESYVNDWIAVNMNIHMIDHVEVQDYDSTITDCCGSWEDKDENEVEVYCWNPCNPAVREIPIRS